MKRPLLRVPVLAIALLALGATPALASDHHQRGHGHKGPPAPLERIKHIVVVYEENHSFDNLYGGWEGVEGLGAADAAHTTQVDQAGNPYTCLLQDDVNLTSPPLPATCTDKTFSSAFPNRFFTIDDFIAPTDTTCPAPGAFAANGVPKGAGEPGGCTRDLVHRFYQEQYQLNGGAQNRYVTGSDAVGLTMGVYDTKTLPIYAYLHQPGHPSYAIADRFFQAAFGGSFLNHQWLIAAASPTFPGAPADLHSLVDDNGFPTTYPLYKPTRAVRDSALTVACDSPHPAGLACGDFAVNTIQPPFQPFGSGTQLPAQKAPTIGDRLSARGVDWAWYSGGWSNANGDVGAPGWTNSDTACTDPDTAPGSTFPNCPDKLFQFHHQPFNYFASFARHAGAARAPPRRAGVPRGVGGVAQALPPEAGELHQADRGRERAPGLRERAHRLRPPREPPEAHRGLGLRAGHDGRRDLRRVRRPVGPRVAAGPGHRDAGPARQHGPEHAHPGARPRAGAAARLLGRPRLARHDGDHGDD